MIKDVKLKADAVKILLKFLYSDFEDVTGINDGSVWDVLYAGTGMHSVFIIHPILNIYNYNSELIS